MMEYEGVPYNFGGIEEERSGYGDSKVVILPVPYDATTSYRSGSREGPGAIIRASRNMELFDERTGREIYRKFGIHTADEVAPDTTSPERMAGIVEKAVASGIDDNKFLVLVGGEHSLSVGAVTASAARYENLSVLQLDAHADLRDSYAGSKYNHACTMRRIVEICPIVQAGVRSMCREDHEFIRDHDISSLSADEIAYGGDVLERIVDGLTETVYVTIDLDVLDPSEMPSVGTPEPGGLRWIQVMKLLAKVAARKRIIGFDVMELSPLPGVVAPDFAAAKLIYRFLTEIFTSPLALVR